MTTRRPKPLRSGYTLLEVVLGLALLTILSGTMISTILFSTRALSDSNGPVAGAVESGDVLQDIARDVQMATAFNERSGAGIRPVVLDFLVPDRDGDSVPETIRYEWAGTPGDPITRIYNNGKPSTVAEDVQEFSLSYITRLRRSSAAAASNLHESAELSLAEFDPGGTATRGVTSTTMYAHRFLPTLPKNCTSWRITRIEVRLKRTSALSTGDVTAQVKGVDGSNKPAAPVIDSSSINVTTVPTTLTTVSFPFSTAIGLAPGTAYCFTINGGLALANADVQYRTGVSTGSGILFTDTTTGGLTWSSPTNNTSLSFKVYGTYTTQGTPAW